MHNILDLSLQRISKSGLNKKHLQNGAIMREPLFVSFKMATVTSRPNHLLVFLNSSCVFFFCYFLLCCVLSESLIKKTCIIIIFFNNGIKYDPVVKYFPRPKGAGNIGQC